ncbi:reverse transcriptase domain-containing protein [Tanacetum coccineum]
MFKYGETENEAVRLMMFPLSLMGEAKTWLDELNEGTIESWDELRTTFISRFFPPSLVDRLFGEIRAFSQHEHVTPTDAWLLMKEMLRNFHGHNLTKGNINKIFYHDLNETTQEALNATAGAFADEDNSNSDIDKIMARIDAMTMKMDVEYKEIQSLSNHSNTDYNDDDTPINDEDEESTPQPKSQTPKPVKETPIPKPYKPKILSENMLVEVGKFTFPVDFVILKMKEDSKVPRILRRPFLNTADAVIRVKQKQLNLGVGIERMIFHIDSAMKHSYSNDDTCFSIDIIDEILEEDFDALLDEGSKILYSIEGTPLKEKLFAEFDEFMAMNIEENSESDSDNEEPTFKKITFDTNYKIKISLEEPPSDL